MILLNEEWYVVTVQIKGKAHDYKSAGHGVKHRIMDSGFNENNIKIVNIRKMMKNEIEDNEESYNLDVDEIISWMKEPKQEDEY